MRLFTFIGLLGLLTIPAAAQPPVQPGDSAAFVRHAHVSADAFVRLWRYYWELSEQYRHITGPLYANSASVTWDPPPGVPRVALSVDDALTVQADWVTLVVPRGKQWNGVDSLRTDLLHCHMKRDAHQIFPELMIQSDVGGLGRKRAVCPSWFAGGAFPPWDERTYLDAAIAPELRPAIVAARATLLTELTGAAATVPGDGWLAGQTVRFALDQGDTTRAFRAAESCRAAAWWCTALVGYIRYARHEVAPADSLFGVMLTEMPEEERCVWTDLTPLLEATGRQAYARLPCADRDAMNARLWWLSDPLYTEPGNERRAEHLARHVLIAIRTGTSWNERWDLRPPGGGDAMAEMLLRYGWPSFSFWGGRAEDIDHFAYFGIVPLRRGDHDDTLQTHGRFATAEYSADRFHAVPSWDAVMQPMHSEAIDWVLSAQAESAVDPKDTLWWPQEHYQRAAGPLVQLWNQAGLFRRQDSTLLVMATDLWPATFGSAETDSLHGALVLSTGPGDAMRMEPATGVLGYTTVTRAMLAPRPQLVSLELYGQHPAGVAARTRFGVEPPPPLATMRPGEIAISAPVFFQPLSLDDTRPIDGATALARMYGNTVFTFSMPGRSLGVYWETYGIHDGDTADVEIRVERHDAPSGMLRRLRLRLGLGERRQSAVAFGWREPAPGREVTTIPGPVPIQTRNVSLNVSQLAPGDYTLVVSVTRPGGSTITGSRDFRIMGK